MTGKRKKENKWERKRRYIMETEVQVGLGLSFTIQTYTKRDVDTNMAKTFNFCLNQGQLQAKTLATIVPKPTL